VQTYSKDIDQTTLDLIDRTEENLIGALLIAGSDGSRQAIEAVSVICQLDDFCLYRAGDSVRRRIYAAMLESTRTDQITVANTMHRQGRLQPRDISYMSHCISVAVSSLDCEIYAQDVHSLAQERRGQIKPVFRGAI